MRKRTLVSMGVILASATLVGVNLATGRSGATLPPRPEAPETAASAEIEALRRQIRETRAWIQKHRSSPAEPGVAPDGPAPAWPEIPEAVREAGARLGVTEAALEAAFRLEHAAREKRPFPGGYERLLGYGGDGFRAVVAVIRGGYRATWQRGWLQKIWEPGLEQVLIDLADDPNQEMSQGFALWLLAIADTPEVRDYLVARAAGERTPERVYRVAMALGDLREPRGAAPIEGKFKAEGWSGVRPDILESLGKMGGADARRILIEYLRDEDADVPGRAALALRRIDPEAAREEARRVLARPQARFLDGIQRSCLDRAAEK